MTDKRKAKRVLKNIDFSSENAHLALVGPSVGGPANGADYALVLKSNANFTEEIIQKAQQIKVTMELPDFLQKFFGLYYEDAMILAHLLGYEMPEKDDTEVESYDDYIKSKLESFEIIKSMQDSKDIPVVMSKLTGEQYLKLLSDQSMLEKEFAKREISKQNGSTDVNSEVGAETEAETIEKAAVKGGDYVSWNSSGGKAYGRVKSVKTSGSIRINDNVSIEAEADNPAALIEVYRKDESGSWKPSGVMVGHKSSTLSKISALKKANRGTNSKTEVNSKEIENTMTTDNTNVQVTEMEVEVVEKSVLEAIEKAAKAEKEALEKALNQQKEELQKALDLVKQFEQAQKDAITKARKAAVVDAVKDEEKAEVLFKALNLVEDADFDAAVKVLKGLSTLVEKSELFTETGVTVESEGAVDTGVSPVAKLLKAKYAK